MAYRGVRLESGEVVGAKQNDAGAFSCHSRPLGVTSVCYNGRNVSLQDTGTRECLLNRLIPYRAIVKFTLYPDNDASFTSDQVNSLITGSSS